MFVLGCLIAIGVLLFAIWIVDEFNTYCRLNFGYEILKTGNVVWTITAYTFLFLAWLFYTPPDCDPLNSILLAAISFIILAALFNNNIKRTNFSCGIGGTLSLLGISLIWGLLFIFFIIAAAGGDSQKKHNRR